MPSLAAFKVLGSSGHRPLLLIGIASFAIVSAYTNYEGVRLIFGVTDPALLGIVSSLLIGAAITLFMTDLTLQIAAQRSSDVLRLIVAYLSLAIVSVFFTFNSLYTHLSGIESEKEAYSRIQQRGMSLVAKYQLCVKVSTDLDKIDQDVATKEAQAKLEKERSDRPGEGVRYWKLKEQLTDLQAKRDALRSRSNELMLPAKLLEEDLSKLPPRISDIERRQLGSRVLAFGEKMNAVKCSVDFDVETLRLDLDDPSKPAHSLYVIGLQLREASQGRAAGPVFYRFCISAALSLIIDLTVFLAVVLSRRAGSTDSSSVGSARFDGRLYEDPDEFFPKS